MFGNPIVGGNNALVREAIQSEGFVSGSAGWRIERDGDAEFNSITARGDVVLDGTSVLLVYDGDGNIIAAISPAGGTDPESGQTYAKGIDSYDTELGARTYQINIRDGVIIFNFLQSNTFLQNGLLQANEPLSAGTSPSLGMYAPSDNSDQLQAAVVCYGTSQDGSGTHRVRVTGIDPVDGNSGVTTLLDVFGDAEISGSISAGNILTGTETVTFATDTSHIRTVNFSAMPAAPAIVVPVISSGEGETIGWVANTDSYTSSSFRLLMNGPSTAWSSIPVKWLAIG